MTKSITVGTKVRIIGGKVYLGKVGTVTQVNSNKAFVNGPFRTGKKLGNVTEREFFVSDLEVVEKTTISEMLSKPLNSCGDTSPHLIIEARAGTGKTTTLIEGLKRVKGIESKLTPSPQQKAVWDAMELSKGKVSSICFVAFNKSIATELQNRVPAGCQASTMHGMGYKAVRNAYGNVQVNEYRVQDLISEILSRDPRELRRDPRKALVVKAVEDLVGLCKMNLVEMNPISLGYERDGFLQELEKLASHYEIDINGSKTEIFDLVPQVLEKCKDVTRDNAIDFNDMIWIPVVNNLPITKYDMLLVDEAQDLNRCQQALAKSAGRRLILCGDPKQAIYGFAGADAESMSRMARELGAQGQSRPITSVTRPDGTTERGCIVLPLTVTRRCGKAIVRQANKIVADFDAFDTNGEGAIYEASYKVGSPQDYTKMVDDGDFILCRVNAPLVSQCFRFIKQGRKANIQGRDVGKGLISTIQKMKASDSTELVSKLSDWLHGETRKENAKRFPSENKLIAIQDRYDCLMCFVEGTTMIQEVISKIENIFTDDKNSTGIKFSSIHKAKGLEARRVFLLEPEGATVPHPMAKSSWQIEQEWNLRYVAITRAIEELVFVS